MGTDKKQLTFANLINVILPVNKLYQCAMLPAVEKLRVYKLINKLREEEKLYIRLKKETHEKHVKRDENNKPLTKIVKKDGNTHEIWDYKDDKAYIEEIEPILNTPVLLSIEMINIDFNSLFNTPLTVKEIETLVEFGIVKEKEDKKDGRSKIAIIKK